jgi:phage-related protein
MSDTTELIVALIAKDLASAGISAIGKRLEGLGPAGDVAKLAIAGVTAGIGAAVIAGIGFARAAADEEQGIARLAQAVSNAGGNWGELQGGIESTIAAMEKTTAFSDGEMRDALSSLITSTGSVDQAMKRLPTTLDLVHGKGIDVATAANLMGKGTETNIASLRKLIPTISATATAEEAFAATQKAVAGQSGAFAKTASGQWQIFAHDLDNLKEDLGGFILPLFTKFGGIAIGAIDAIRAALADATIAGTLQSIASAAATGFTILTELFGVITGTAPDAGAALTGAVGPATAKEIMGALATIREAVRGVFAFILNDILPPVRAGFAFLAEHWESTSFAMKAIAVGVLVPAFAAWAVAAGTAAVATIAALAPVLIPIAAIGVAAFALHEAWEHNFLGIRDVADRVFGWIGDTIRVFQEEGLGGLLHRIGELAMQVPAAFTAIGKGIVQGLWAGIQALGGWIGDRIHDFVMSTIPEAIRNLLGIHSPSTVMAEIGKQIIEGLAGGIADNATEVKETLGGVVGQLTATARAAALQLTSILAVRPTTVQTAGSAVAQVLATSSSGISYDPRFGFFDLSRDNSAFHTFGGGIPALRAQTQPIVVPVSIDGREVARAVSNVVMDDYVSVGGRISG